MRLKIYKLSAGALLFSMVMLMLSCEEKPANGNNPVPALDNDAVSSSGTMKFGGEIISIPSPVQVVSLIQKNNIPFNESLMNPLSSRTRYVNETKKALNLGIYGADLAYVANYSLGQAGNDYFDVVAGLANDLGILEKVDKGLITKLTANIANRDSLIKLNADFFRAGDRYLKGNGQGHISAYILIGGWIESLHLAANAVKGNDTLRTRLGEQKYSAQSIMKLTSRLEDESFSAIRSSLEDLCEELSALESTYSYRQPINDQRNKTTYLRSQTQVTLSDEQLAAINEQIMKVRNLIIE